ncbi:spoIIIJ-associated protein [Lysinibacillus composti]|uniref:RNA-binding protein KhpB n=1 Tax=Lysinibacillus composti TaxID=720633 RepID=A0A3N9UCI1_9BACI|nr:RNA-binding cell elongation regulator Jag/EloR [Lysinibacillus composti]MBM7609502.1 spoIIIJ-associated protein [Lysinibacillus composti]RQW74031.1 protein jag [Lysinibacillus composti]
MKQITQLGATKEEAISLALQKLDTSIEEVEVEVLQEAKKGFLGFGVRQAEVRVTLKEVEEPVKVNKIEVLNEEVTVEESLPEEVKHLEPIQVEESTVQQMKNDENVLEEDPIEVAKAYLTNIAEGMGIGDLKIQAETQGKNTLFKLESEKAAMLIGKRGATLNALQQLTQLVINKSAKTFMLVKLDVENYRERREIALEQLAERLADKAVRTGKKVSLEPMPSYERKVIHHTLSNRIDIETYSEGTEPNRHLVIEPIK